MEPDIRMIVITSMGVGDSKQFATPNWKFIMKYLLNKAMQDKEEQEKIVKASSHKNWVIVRPAFYVDVPLRKLYRSEHFILGGGRIGRYDTAHFVEQCFLNDTWIGFSPSIAYQDFPSATLNFLANFKNLIKSKL